MANTDTNTDTLRLSERIAITGKVIADQLAELGHTGLHFDVEDAHFLLGKLHEFAADAKRLERMLERRLRASDIPGASGAPAAPLPAPTAGDATPALPGNLVQFRPRADARLVPFNGGAA